MLEALGDMGWWGGEERTERGCLHSPRPSIRRGLFAQPQSVRTPQLTAVEMCKVLFLGGHHGAYELGDVSDELAPSFSSKEG